MISFSSLHTARTEIRYLRETDADALFEIYSDADAMKYRANPPMTERADAERMIIQAKEDREARRKLRLAVVNKSDGQLIGTVLIFRFYTDDCEIGYSFGKPHWKKGFGREVVHALCTLLFEKGILCIHAHAKKENLDSIRLLQKTGFAEVTGENPETSAFVLHKAIWNPSG